MVGKDGVIKSGQTGRGQRAGGGAESTLDALQGGQSKEQEAREGVWALTASLFTTTNRSTGYHCNPAIDYAAEVTGMLLRRD